MEYLDTTGFAFLSFIATGFQKERPLTINRAYAGPYGTKKAATEVAA